MKDSTDTGPEEFKPQVEASSTPSKPVESSGIDLGKMTDASIIGKMTSGVDVGKMTSGIDIGKMTSGINIGKMTDASIIEKMTSASIIGKMTSGVDIGKMTTGSTFGRVTAGLDLGQKTAGLHLGKAYSLANQYMSGFEPNLSSTPQSTMLIDNAVSRLRLEVDDLRIQVGQMTEHGVVREKAFQALQLKYDEFLAMEKLQHLMYRVGEPARVALTKGSELKPMFDQNESCDAFVISIDLRRSTELMLKAREPRLFAEFITSLAGKLRDEILKRFGVFDKFTGDGILAFFPEFFSSPFAGLLAVDAAKACHKLFAEHYRDHRRIFVSVLNNAGLGIGIDYGKVSMVQISNDLTVVGTPVVFACRLGGASAGETLANQPAYEILLEQFSAHIDFHETEIDFKHEGPTLAYRVSRNEKPLPEIIPHWHPNAVSKPPNDDGDQLKATAEIEAKES